MLEMYENILWFGALSIFMVVVGHYIANFRLGTATAQQMIETGNTAFGIRRAGLSAGMFVGALALSQNIAAKEVVAWGDIGQLLGGMALLTVFMFTALSTVDRVILHHKNNDLEIINGNTAVAFVEACILFGTGWIAYGSLLGEGSLLTSIGFFIVGQLVFIITAFLAELAATDDIKLQVSEGNLSIALWLGTVVMVIGMFVSSGIEGDFTSWSKDLAYFGTYFAGIVSLYVIYLLVFDKLIISGLFHYQDTLSVQMIKTALRLAVAVMLIMNFSI